MKLERKMVLFTGVLFVASLVVVFLILGVFFTYIIRRELQLATEKMFDTFVEDVKQSFVSPVAIFGRDGRLLVGEDPGIGENGAQSFFQQETLSYAAGILYIDAKPYVWLREKEKLSLIPVSPLWHISAVEGWRLFLVSLPRYQSVSLTKVFALEQGFFDILKRFEEKLLIEGKIGPLFTFHGVWFMEVLKPGLWMVGYFEVRLFRVLFQHFFYIGLTILILFLGIYFWFQHRLLGRFTRTWRSFLEGVKRFEQQDYHYRIPLEPDVGEEMRETVLAFNRLAETLETSYYANDKLFQQLRYNYYHDKLTGLPNGNKFLEDFSAFEHPNLFLFDIENFSEWNMYFGSSEGDRVLIQTARRLSSLSIYQKTFLYKLWADRFLLVIDQLMEKRELEVMATYFLENLSNLAYDVSGQQVYLSFVAGILGANLLSPGIEGNAILTSMASILKKAIEMHTFFFIAEDMQQISYQTEENLKTLAKVREAIQHSYVVNFYQPIINNHTARVEKYEALVR
ncbi:MAG: diguanylate cyclase domain-containing protein, partial [Brevinematales bacterium]